MPKGDEGATREFSMLYCCLESLKREGVNVCECSLSLIVSPPGEPFSTRRRDVLFASTLSDRGLLLLLLYCFSAAWMGADFYVVLEVCLRVCVGTRRKGASVFYIIPDTIEEGR